MIKKCLIIALFFVIVNAVNGEEFFYNRNFLINGFPGIEIKDGNFRYYADNPNEQCEFINGKYTLVQSHKYDLLIVGDYKLVIFHLSDTIIMYDYQQKRSILGTDYAKGGFTVSREPSLFKFRIAKSDSYLKEGNKEYKAENLSDYDFTTPWVEGEKNAGVGVKLSLEFGRGASYPVDNMVFINGFFSPDDLSLYEENNRLKKIKIVCLDNSFEFITELEDTPNMQFVKLPKKGKKFELTILSVYPGTKYNDTCLSGLLANYYISYP